MTSPGRLDTGPSLWVGPPAVSERPRFTGWENDDLHDRAPEEDRADMPEGAAGAADALDDWDDEPRTWHDRWRGSLPGVIAGAAVVISFSLVLAAGPKHQASRVASGRPAPTTATTAVAGGGAVPTLPPGADAPALPGTAAEVAAPESDPSAGSGTAVRAAAARPVPVATPPKPRPATPAPAPPPPAATTGDTAPPSTPPTTEAKPPVDTTTAPTTTVIDGGGDDEGPPAGCLYFPNLPGC